MPRDPSPIVLGKYLIFSLLAVGSSECLYKLSFGRNRNYGTQVRLFQGPSESISSLYACGCSEEYITGTDITKKHKYY